MERPSAPESGSEGPKAVVPQARAEIGITKSFYRKEVPMIISPLLIALTLTTAADEFPKVDILAQISVSKCSPAGTFKPLARTLVKFPATKERLTVDRSIKQIASWNILNPADGKADSRVKFLTDTLQITMTRAENDFYSFETEVNYVGNKEVHGNLEDVSHKVSFGSKDRDNLFNGGLIAVQGIGNVECDPRRIPVGLSVEFVPTYSQVFVDDEAVQSRAVKGTSLALSQIFEKDSRTAEGFDWYAWGVADAYATILKIKNPSLSFEYKDQKLSIEQIQDRIFDNKNAGR